MIFTKDNHQIEFKSTDITNYNARSVCNDDGCYLILSANINPMHGKGTHTALYAGQTINLGIRNRLFGHIKPGKYSDRYRAVRRWPSLVLYVTDRDRAVLEQPAEGIAAKRTFMEQWLHRMFVPLCAFEFEDEKHAGRLEGRTNQVWISTEENRIMVAGDRLAA